MSSDEIHPLESMTREAAEKELAAIPGLLEHLMLPPRVQVLIRSHVTVAVDIRNVRKYWMWLSSGGQPPGGWKAVCEEGMVGVPQGEGIPGLPVRLWVLEKSYRYTDEMWTHAWRIGHRAT
jgi:hypothetical protein